MHSDLCPDAGSCCVNNRSVELGAVLLAVVFSSPAALAQAADPMNQRAWLQLSLYRPSIDTELRVDRNGFPLSGTNLRLERELGLDDSEHVPTFLVAARLGQHWRIELEHYRLRRDGSQSVLPAPITIADSTFDAELDTRLDSDVTRVSAGWSFHRSTDREAGVQLGIHATRFEIDVTGRIDADGNTAVIAREFKRKTVPLPTIGAYGVWRLGQDWTASGRIDLLPLKARGFKGDLINLEANVLYAITNGVSVGIGYRLVDYKVSGSSGAFSGRVEYEFRGPQLLLQAGF